MKYLLLLILCLGITNCQRCDGCQGTYYSKCKPYAGDLDRPEPYRGEVKIETWRGGIDTILAKVPLHNPTAKHVSAKVSCDFYLDNWHASNSVIENIKVCPLSTVYAELRHGGSFLESQKAGVTCFVVWQF